MQYVISDTFSESLADLTNSEQKRVKQTVFDFQVDRTNPGLSLHKLDRTEDDNFWSARVSDDLRIIVHKQDDHFVFCYVDHHDDAYEWAERRKLSRHPKTGAVQLVEVEKRTEEIVQRVYRQKEAKLFDEYEDEYLLKLGVPPEWLEAVKHVGETEFLKLLDRLPEEVGERLLSLADGEPVPVPKDKTKAVERDPFEHPDSKRRFHVVEDERELKQALEWPWERWIVFLHPRQRGAIEKTYNGPAYVSGGAGTGKTVVAMHWTSRMIEENDEEVLLTTFSKTLASQLERGMDILVGPDAPERDNLQIVNLHKLARDIWCEEHGRELDIVTDDEMREWLAHDAERQGLFEYSDEFLFNEWEAIVDAWGIDDWETYRDVSRRGRGTPLGAKQRYALWPVFEGVLARLDREGKCTWSGLCYNCIEFVEDNDDLGFEHVVVDEAQDFGPAELQLLETMAEGEQNNLFLVGDSGQRLYKRYFNWSDVGIHVVGRSTRLKVNYRTTEQIRDFADDLMPPELAEHGDGSGERDAVSLLTGLDPDVEGFDNPDDESTFIAETIDDLLDDGFDPRDIAIFGRTRQSVLEERAIPAAELLDLEVTWLQQGSSERPSTLSVGTMHSAKGLEFRAVIVAGCDRQAVPATWVLDEASDEAERKDLLERERNLLYVACTRAREHLTVTYTGEPSRFLQGEEVRT